MKKIILLIVGMVSLQASAELLKTRVCGVHKLTRDGAHFILTRSSRGKTLSYEIFASNRHSAEILENLEANKKYCIDGTYNPDRPLEGIAVTSARPF